MPKTSLIVASITALLTFAASAPSHAQSQSDSSQSIPDAPQPQKKPAAKPQSSDPGSQPTDKTSSDKSNTDKTNTDPQASDSSSPDKPTPPPKTTKDDNPFPEDVSKQAAKAAGNDPAPTAKPDVPPGFSSSQSNPDNGSDQIVDPPRAKKDAEVGGFYLKHGDYQGALLRYKDATTSDPTNVEAIFGLAETQRMLKKNAEAVRNYQLYLDIVPDGPRAKQALKALKALGSGG